MAALERLLRERGGRSTRQRRALYRALAGRTDHPTAEELHREVRRSIPSLSLATVYTSLDALVRAGAAARIVHADGLAHFDARTDPHGHRRCGRCGRVEDVEIPHRPERIADIPLGDFTLTGFHIELFGTCADCDRSGGARSEP
jgi:Fur family peroxide stress response transcriptional regulator